MGSHANENEKSLLKFKILKNGEKNGLEIWWIATFPPNLALIPLMVSEKPLFMDDGWMDDGRLRHGIISADQSSRGKSQKNF